MSIHIGISLETENTIPINTHNQVSFTTPALLHQHVVDLQQTQEVKIFSFSPVHAHTHGHTHKYTRMHLLKILKLFNENNELDGGNVPSVAI